jgi:2,5-diamino-6-(ribosylamino)-4(3H)-pyrimidinone 5'-phosphate reductase
MNRPYVICHMGPSIDGKIVTARWSVSRTLGAEYERVAASFDADAWIIGRVSMEPYAGKTRVPRRAAKRELPRTNFIAEHSSESFAIAVDPSGKLAWKSNAIDGEHVITILHEEVSDDYLVSLRKTGVSYLFGGRKRINLGRVLEDLKKSFGIRKLLLEGGGSINGSFLEADLIDELSILVAPVADGSIGTPTLFDASPRGVARRLTLKSVEKRKGGIVWLRYKVRHG